MTSRLMNTLLFVFCLIPGTLMAEPSQRTRDELHQVMADFVQGWREGDADRLGRVFAMAEGRIHWVSGEGDEEVVKSMTFQAAVDRGKTNPAYGLDGWEILSMDVLDDELAMVKLEIQFGKYVSIDFMICQKVRGEWRIVSNTFVTRERPSQPGPG